MEHPDEPRPAATPPDAEYAMSLDEVAERYARAGHPRTLRTLQRYCASGHLDCQKVETMWGDKYMVTSRSIDRHIAQIEEMAPTIGRDLSRPAAAADVVNPSDEHSEPPVPTGSDTPRPDATESRYVAALESENQFLRNQISVKDDQIQDLTQRAHETNSLIAGLQRMLTPLLGKGERDEQREL